MRVASPSEMGKNEMGKKMVEMERMTQDTTTNKVWD